MNKLVKRKENKQPKSTIIFDQLCQKMIFYQENTCNMMLSERVFAVFQRPVCCIKNPAEL